jgi:decaprenylphospho-beta-D-ribofuranose 2-oxidase
VLNKWTVRAFNEAWYRKARPAAKANCSRSRTSSTRWTWCRSGTGSTVRGGFLQYQFVVPDAAGDVVGTALRELQRIGAPSFLTVLKRLRAANPGPLSFPQPGWTLAADVPARIRAWVRLPWTDLTSSSRRPAGGCTWRRTPGSRRR